MMWQAENLSLLRKFSACRIINGSLEPFCINGKGFILVFVKPDDLKPEHGS